MKIIFPDDVVVCALNPRRSKQIFVSSRTARVGVEIGMGKNDNNNGNNNKGRSQGRDGKMAQWLRVFVLARDWDSPEST